METKCGHITLGDKTLFEDDSSDCEGEVGVGALSKPSIKACDFSCPALPSSDTLLKPPLTLLAGLGDTKVSCFVVNFFPYVFFTSHPLDPYNEKNLRKKQVLKIIREDSVMMTER